MRFSLFALALLAAPAFAQADEPLRPGDIDIAAMEPYENSYRIFVIQGAGAGMPFGSLRETFSIEGGVALSTVHVNTPQGPQIDSVWVSWPSLEPIRQRSEAGGTVTDITFNGLSASGTIRDGSTLDASFDAPLFGRGVADMIARSLPMEEGTTASFYSFDREAEGYEATTEIAFGGTEEVLGRQARVITTDDGDQVMTIHYDEAEGEVLQMSFAPQPGVSVEIRRSDLETEAAE